jgi:G:T/U-mismatch repair DNA glycosylase
MAYPSPRQLWRIYRKVAVADGATKREVAAARAAFEAGMLAILKLMAVMVENGDTKAMLATLRKANRELNDLEKALSKRRH